jgi:uncharacterized membrane protein
MNGVPLHPALVHVPLGLAFAVPVVALALAWAVWSERLPRRAWLLTVVLQAMLLAGGIVAMRAGEAEEDRVEPIVGEAAIERHEEAAVAFLWTAGATLLVAVAPLFLGGGGMRASLAIATLATFAVAGMAVRTGKAGGELVYVHGAAGAYVQGKDSQVAPGAEPAREDDRGRGRGRGGRDGR